jgi:hypothetical protein
VSLHAVLSANLRVDFKSCWSDFVTLASSAIRAGALRVFAKCASRWHIIRFGVCEYQNCRHEVSVFFTHWVSGGRGVNDTFT